VNNHRLPPPAPQVNRPVPKPAFLKAPFTITYELNPPRGVDPSFVLDQAKRVSRYVDAFNLTDNPMSSLRMAPGPLAARIQADLGVPTIPHITGRDRNVLALQSELLGFHFLGIRNVFALTGDPMKIGDHPEAKGVYELYANQLIELVGGLNKGRDHVGKDLQPGTAFSIGAAVTLTDTRPEGLDTFRKKLEAGADFFQTQIVLDPSTLETPAVAKYETDRPVLLGTVPLKNPKVLDTLRKIPGIDIPERFTRRLATAPDFAEAANQAVLELRDAIKGRYAGLHLMPINPNHEQILALLAELRGARTSSPVPMKESRGNA
jgi:5,10-methylenetetrahydrofolate reductase